MGEKGKKEERRRLLTPFRAALEAAPALASGFPGFEPESFHFTASQHLSDETQTAENNPSVHLE